MAGISTSNLLGPKEIRVIFEIANNHQGSFSHFEKILNDIYQAINPYKDQIEFVIKFQFRDIPSFVDESIDPSTNKHIERFKQTQLTDQDWSKVFSLVKSYGLITMVTPFDEASIAKAISLNVDEFKIASCSCTEWSLLEGVSSTENHITVSTGGRNLSEIDKIYSYLAHKIPNRFTIMHCCGIYPAPTKDLNIRTISKLKQRYPLAKIGYSGHEDPYDHSISSLAISLGASALERHIGKADSENNINLNAYSISSENISSWLKSIKHTITALGTSKKQDYINEIELDSLLSLQRGVFISKSVIEGEKLDSSNCVFKFPIQKNQISASEITSRDLMFKANKNIDKGTRLTYDLANCSKYSYSILLEYVHNIRGIINEYGEYVAENSLLEISHHYGIEKIFDYGCCLINIVNRSYCKKLIIMTENQEHPTQHHNVKEETFRILHGQLELKLDGHIHNLKMGDEALVRSDVRHSFKAMTDCIIEEISTTSVSEDSFYEDNLINNLKREDRKTLVKLHPKLHSK